MSLATRCPSCGTVFRVVQDQLRVSEGWVRCGRCTEVFNAVEHLVDVEAETRARESARSAHRERVMDDLARITGQAPLAEEPKPAAWSDSSRPAPISGFDEGASVPAPVSGFGQASSWPAPISGFGGADSRPAPFSGFDDAADEIIVRAAALDAAPAPDASDAGAWPGEAAARGVSATDEALGAAPASVAEAAVAPAAPAEAAAVPAFVRQAERAARWRHPGVRAGLAAACAVAAAALALQVTLEYRDLAAARWPGLRPLLEQACSASGCRIEAPQLIEALAVESSGLVRGDGMSDYRLSVALRNRAGHDVAMPALDLTLTDSRGGVIARRVLRSSDFGTAPASVAAGGELVLQAALSAGERPVSGYTIELFYP